MDFDAFWELMEAGREDPERVVQAIRAMSEQELVEFDGRCAWCAGRLVDEDDERREAVAQWVVQQGEQAWEDVVYQQSALPDAVPEYTSYRSLADAEYRRRYERPMRGRDDPPATELLWADFWALIESGREDPDVVVRQIKAMTEQELVNLWWRFQDAVDLLSTYDDEDEDVASWVVQQGKVLYDRMLADPGQMPLEVPAWNGPSYRGEVVEAYEDRYGDFIRDQDYEGAGHIEIEPDAFWDLIDSGREDPTVVERAIDAMSERELVEFNDRYEQAVVELTDGPYLDNAEYDGVHSEDHHLDIAEWIVSRGRRFYAIHLADPKLFPLEPGHDDPTYIHYAANVYRERYGLAIRAPEDPPPAAAAPAAHRKKGLLARLFGHGDP